MPRNVRNWWIEGSIDGRDTPISGGPSGKDGGFELTIKQRDNGRVATALRVIGKVMIDGTLVLEVHEAEDTGDSKPIFEQISSVVSHRDKPSTDIPGVTGGGGRLIGVKYG